MRTWHHWHTADARDPGCVPDGSVQLVVTSPPYPMVQMWDAVFSEMRPAVRRALRKEDGMRAFAAMHAELDRVWAMCARALCPGGIVCINIGDATRTLAGAFQLYPNHARILQGLMAAGFSVLPDILWRKPTNAPSKFMGSGMLPAGAYVTYEHEYILIARKGNRRRFTTTDARTRRSRSAYFWEERNLWFSDLWSGIHGTKQALPAPGLRGRSAAFPLEIPLRLIRMYSAYEDVVLDPFAGTGTTAAAALLAGRSSLSLDVLPELQPVAGALMEASLEQGVKHGAERLARHRAFVEERQAMGRTLKHHNPIHDVAVMTRQEVGMEIWVPGALHGTASGWEGQHSLLSGDATK